MKQTRRPATAPPSLYCPRCQRELVYRYSIVADDGSEGSDRRDAFSCKVCGQAFDYLHRTSELRLR